MISNPAMRFEPALTKGDSTAIQERGADSADMRALLWEVARLRAMLEDESVVQEQQRL